jgi:hypothetical protein
MKMEVNVWRSVLTIAAQNVSLIFVFMCDKALATAAVLRLEMKSTALYQYC